MNPAQLLAHFDRISDAPDAIPRLRQFILDLAVRGKLVEQDPRDEPASELLRRIQEEKARLVKEGLIKPQSKLATVVEGRNDFVIPYTWVLTTLGEIAQKITDGAHKTPTYVEKGVPFISVKDFSGGKLNFSRTRFISTEEHEALYKRCDPRRGDILIGRIGTLGKAVLVDTDIEFSLFVSVGLIRFSQDLIVPGFFRLLLNSPHVESEFDRIKIGGATHTNKLNLGDLHSIMFPLPPIAEQHRIVAKVNELMALCDRLEVAQAERESRRDRLVASSLNRLNNGADAGAFRDHARFYFNHLPRLTIKPEHIHQLRQTILNLAVRGRLVAQDPHDEPASELLVKIQTDNTKLLEAGEAKERRRHCVDASVERLFEIPKTWHWVSLGEIASEFRYGTSVKCTYEPIGYPVLRIPNIDNGRVNVEDLKFGALSVREANDLQLQLGDILMVRSNGSLNLVGRPALVDAHVVGFCYAGYLVRVRMSTSHLDARYLLLALNTTHVRDQIEIPIRSTVGLKNVNATELGRLSIPLPPLAEQHRIVAQVDELMALCDRLEVQLATTHSDSRRLLEAVLHEALAPAV